jgi:hypothetical protein
MEKLINCPSELELNDYLENRLGEEKRESILTHIADCSHCLSLLAIGHKAREMEKTDLASTQMLRRAKNIAREAPGKKLVNYKWQISAFISFVLSFILTRFFLQFLILAVIFSIKWIFDSGSTRTLIMIYEAWRGKEKGTARKIIQDFQEDRIKQKEKI